MNNLLIKEVEKDEYLIGLLISSIVLLALSVIFTNFFGYICGLGGIGYGLAFMYKLSKNKNKVLRYGSQIMLGVLFIMLIYFMFLNVKPTLTGLISGIIVISIPILLMNKKFFPVIIPLNLTSKGLGLNVASVLMPSIISLIKAHPLIVIASGIVAIYFFFKMAKDIIKIIILTVIAWAILRFLVGLI